MQRTQGLRTGIPAALALLLAGPLAGTVAAVVPLAGGPVNSTSYAINVSTAVDANDPHVGGDLAVYTAENAVIRYYSFATAADASVPPGLSGAVDVLSDVSDGRIAFSRIAGGSSRIMVFDTASSTTTEIDPQATVFRLGAAIGGNTVAFIDQTTASTANLHAAFVGGASFQVTNDGRVTSRPSVAPAGNLIVYESCASDPADCSVRQAAWSGSSWVVSNITGDGTEAEGNPDTDGAMVVYDADRGGDREIAWQPAGGGAEQVLTMAGAQRNPSVSSGVILFESGADPHSAADLWLYRMADNTLYQITSTPLDDTLSDVIVLPTGVVRVVWAEGPEGSRDVRGADLTLPQVAQTYDFGGLLQPVDPRPTLNAVRAGAAVPVKFSLGGDRGLDIFAAGYPKSQVILCDSTADVDGIEQTVPPGGSNLTYDPIADVYSYVWKTDKAWAGTCRQLVLAFADGLLERANFKLR